MQAITTKYLGPTNTQGARIKATCEAGSITVGYRHDLSGDAVHAIAAMALVRKLKWGGIHSWISGSTKDGYVFVESAANCGNAYSSEFR